MHESLILTLKILYCLPKGNSQYNQQQASYQQGANQAAYNQQQCPSQQGYSGQVAAYGRQSATDREKKAGLCPGGVIAACWPTSCSLSGAFLI